MPMSTSQLADVRLGRRAAVGQNSLENAGQSKLTSRVCRASRANVAGRKGNPLAREVSPVNNQLLVADGK